MANILRDVGRTYTNKYRHLWIVVAYEIDTEHSTELRPIVDHEIYGIFTDYEEAEEALDRAYSDGWDDVICEDIYMDKNAVAAADKGE